MPYLQQIPYSSEKEKNKIRDMIKDGRLSGGYAANGIYHVMTNDKSPDSYEPDRVPSAFERRLLELGLSAEEANQKSIDYNNAPSESLWDKIGK